MSRLLANLAPTCRMPFASTNITRTEAGLCLHLGRHANFGDYIPPSTSVVMERCFTRQQTMSNR